MKTQASREVMDQMAHAMRELLRMPEWQIYEGYLLAKVEQKRTAIEGCDLDDFLPLQGEIKGIRECLDIPRKIINEATKEKKE